MKNPKLKNKKHIGHKRDGSVWNGNICLIDGKSFVIKLVLAGVKPDGTEVYTVRHQEVKEQE